MLSKRFPDRDEVAAVRARAEEVEPGETDESERFRLAGRVMARRELGKFKAPKTIRLVAELPKGPSGKVQRLKLLEI